MTRIIAGEARGRPLLVPDSGTRPTSDRVKESLFSMLEHVTGGFDGLSVLDLYAGSGALGLEAASRGARHVTLVEKSPSAVKAIRANIESTGLSQVTVATVDVLSWAQAAAATQRTWNVVLADPPYETSDADISRVLAVLQAQGRIASAADVVVERAKPRDRAARFPWPEGFEEQSARTYGDTVLHYAVCYGLEGSFTDLSQTAIDDTR